MDLDVIFAYVVGVLAALAVIGALVFVVVWEWCAIRRTLADYRTVKRLVGAGQQEQAEAFWLGRGAVTVPERRQ